MRSYAASAILAGAVVLAPAVGGYAPALSKTPFTVTNDPVHDTVVDTMQQRICTGTVFPIWWSGLPHVRVQAVFFLRPDGTKWVKWSYNGLGPTDFPVVELGTSAQWTVFPPVRVAQHVWYPHFDVWPQGDNRLSGSTVDPYGTMDLTCE